MQGHVVIYIHTEQTKLTYEFHDKAAFQDPSKCHVRIRKGEKEIVKKIGKRKKNWVKIPFLMLTKMILCCRVFLFLRFRAYICRQKIKWAEESS